MKKTHIIENDIVSMLPKSKTDRLLLFPLFNWSRVILPTQEFSTDNENYLHWEELRHKSWITKKFASNKEAFWPLLFFKLYLDSALTPIKEANKFLSLIKGIMLHFWVGLLHTFEDRNERLARILFYLYMLKNEYWAFKYLSVSGKIKKSAKQYAMA